MAGSKLERRLIETSGRLQRLRADLAIAEQQVTHFAAEADEARVRSLVSESGEAAREHREAAKHAELSQRHHDELCSEIAELERAQDALLDRMQAEGTR